MLKGPLLFFLLGVMICWTGTGLAFEPWKGEITTNVNLRKSPGLNGEIITGLKIGDRVVISAEHGGWYNVIVEGETYGYKGWVYGRYLKELQTGEEKTPLSLEKRILETPSEGMLPEGPLAPPQGTAPVVKEVAKKAPLAGGTLKAPLEGALTQGASTPPQEAFPAVRQVAKRKPPIVSDTDNIPTYQGPGVFVRLLLRLSSVILSCLALVFSCRALKLAKAGRDVALQLQRNSQNPR